MKKIVKICCVILILSILMGLGINNSNAEYKTSTRVNSKVQAEENKTKEREIKFGNLIITFEDKMFFNGENAEISQEEKDNNNIVVGVFCGILAIYWIVLLIIFEREDECYTYENDDNIKTLKKYNPMLAGCLVANRRVLARDVTAVVLNLIQKEAINMKMIPNTEGKDDYTYIISENKEKAIQLDEVERYILNWLFGYYEQDEVDLIKKLKELSKRKDFLKHLKHLDNITQKELNKIGANLNKVPFILRILNIFLLIVTVIIASIHIINNGINVHIYGTTILLIFLIIIGVVLLLPLIALVIHIMLLMIVLLKKLVKNTAEKYSGKKMLSTSIFIILSMAFIIAIVYFIVPNKYICLDIFMIGMAILIVKTDNHMTKHSKEILNDYYALQEIKYKIEEYSLIEDEHINYMKIWEEYLIYGVAFGIPVPIVNQLKESYQEDEDIKYLLKCESLYYVCKAYLEVMFDIQLKEKKEAFSIKTLFENDRSMHDTELNSKLNRR